MLFGPRLRTVISDAPSAVLLHNALPVAHGCPYGAEVPCGHAREVVLLGRIRRRAEERHAASEEITD